MLNVVFVGGGLAIRIIGTVKIASHFYINQHGDWRVF